MKNSEGFDLFAADYRALARGALRGKWRRVCLVMALYMLLVALGGLAGVSVKRQFIGGSPVWNWGTIRVGLSGIASYSWDVQLPWNDSFMETVSAFVGMVPGWVWGLVVLGTLLSTFSGMLAVGLRRALNCVAEGGEAKASVLFPWSLYARALGMNLLRGLIIGLWSLLLIVPGIVAWYRYRMADYLLAVHPRMGALEALRESKRLMAGRKGRAFCLDISFIGWLLLAITPTVLFSFISLSAWPIAARLLLAAAINLAVNVPLDVYAEQARIFFYRNAEGRALHLQDEYKGEPLPEIDAPKDSVEAPNANYAAASDMYLQFRCSRLAMAAEGVLADYEAMDISEATEALWAEGYVNGLLVGLEDRRDTLDAILAYAREYGAPEPLRRAVNVLEKQFQGEEMPDERILDEIFAIQKVIMTPVFDERRSDRAKLTTRILDMADRLEFRLNEREPQGAWRQTAIALREAAAQ